MTFAEQCLKRPIAVMLLWLAVMVAGAVCWFKLPIAALPNYDTPTIQVSASLSGASPETMASSVATPLEKKLSTIPGVVNMTSNSLEGATTIVIEFDPSRDIDSAAVDVQSALYQVLKQLPSQMTTPPSFRKINPADAPIIQIGIDSPSMALSDLNRFSDDLISPALSTLNGVAQVTVLGQKRYAVRVEVNPDKLAATNLTLEDVHTALANANNNSPIGELDGKRQMVMLQTSGDLRNAADFAKVIVATRNGQPVRLSDVATVQDSIENTLSYSAVNGNRAIVLSVQRQPGANIVSTIDAIRQLMPKLQAQMPSSVSVKFLNDRSLSIRAAIHDVTLTLLLTIALVVMVILMFLRHIRATIIPALSLANFSARRLRPDVCLWPEPRQYFPDGADHCRWPGGGRCDCGAGEHHALHGRGGNAVPRRIERGERGGVHRYLYFAFPGGGVYPYLLYAGHDWPGCSTSLPMWCR